jgi:tetratricopeptide (TPR) repeat protein
MLLHKLGELAERHQQWAEAEKWYRHCLSIEQAVGSKADQAHIRLKLGFLCEQQDRPAEAEAFYQQSVDLGAIFAGEQWLSASMLVRLGHYSFLKGDHEHAMIWYQHCLKSAKDKAVAAEALSGLGQVALEHGDLEQAGNWLDQSLQTSRLIGAAHHEAMALLTLGALEQKRHEFRKAAALSLKALRIFEKTSNAAAQAEAHYQLGSICEAQGKAAKAIPFYARAESLLPASKETPLLARVRSAQARLRGER